MFGMSSSTEVTPVDEGFMREAIQLAASARAHGNHPFGAVLVVDEKVVIRAENTVITKKNFTHHAEMNLMQLVAASDLTNEEKARAIVYTSTEPCAMCSGAIVWSGIRHVVYGCPCEELGSLAGDDFLMPCRNLLGLSQTMAVKVTGKLDQPLFAIHRHLINQSPLLLYGRTCFASGIQGSSRGILGNLGFSLDDYCTSKRES